jgi:NAD-dependent deacetylase
MLPTNIWEQAVTAVESCDVFLVVGTSAVVHPAAGLIHLARRRGEWLGEDQRATVIEVNIDRTIASDLADIGLYGPSGEILPKVLDRVRNATNG